MITVRALLVALSTSLLLALAAGPASASVAYVDKGEIWVSSDDGAAKVRLSGGQGNWTEVAQSDLGYIVGVQRDAGKAAIYASFTVWNPAGAQIHFGSLSGDVGGLNAYPLGLDITPTGGNIVYGFSHYVYGFPVGTLTRGTYLKATADASTMVPVKVGDSTGTSPAAWPSLVGTRIISTDGAGEIYLQDASSIGSSNFMDWVTAGIAGFDTYRADYSAAGDRIALEYVPDSSSKVSKIALIQTPGLGAGGTFNSCFLPTQGDISQASLSQNGNLVAWSDARGVVLAAVGAIPAAEACPFGGSPKVIAATGTYPSYGPFNVAKAATTGTGGPALGKISSVKLSSALRSGFKVSVTSAVAGKVKVALTIKPSKVGKRGKKDIKLASGSATVAANVAKKIKLKFSSAGKKLKKKLKGKRATLVVSLGAGKTTQSVKLK
jgi:hypothetical protein